MQHKPKYFEDPDGGYICITGNILKLFINPPLIFLVKKHQVVLEMEGTNNQILWIRKNKQEAQDTLQQVAKSIELALGYELFS